MLESREPSSMIESAVRLINRATSRGGQGPLVALAYLRTPWMAALVAGALLNAMLGKCIKYTLNVSRPEGAALTTPACHHHTRHPCSTLQRRFLAAYGSHDYKSYGAVTALLTFGYSVIVAYARIFLTKVHTIPQVVVGAILGSTFAYFWTAHILSGCNSRDRISVANVFCGVGREWAAGGSSSDL